MTRQYSPPPGATPRAPDGAQAPGTPPRRSLPSRRSRVLKMLFLLYLPMVLLITGVEVVNMVLVQRAEIEVTVKDRLALVLPSLGDLLAEGDDPGLTMVLRQIAEQPGVARVILTDRDDRVLRSDLEGHPQPLSMEEPTLLLPVHNHGRIVGRLSVVVDRGDVWSGLRDHLLLSGMNGLLKILALAAVLSIVLGRVVGRFQERLIHVLDREANPERAGDEALPQPRDREEARLLSSFHTLLSGHRQALSEVENRCHQLGTEVSRRRRRQTRTDEELRDISDLVDRSVMLMKVDLDKRVEYVSGRLCEFTGFAAEDLIGLSPHVLAHTDVPRSVLNDMDATVGQGHSWVGEIKVRRRSGDYFWAHVSIHPRLDSAGNRVGNMSVIEDATDRRRLETLSMLDEWTGLRNRRHFLSTLERLVRDGARAERTLSLIFADLDRFHLYNERHGQSAGDAVLKRVAEILGELAHEAGGQAFRIGGDSFAILLDGDSEGRGETLAEQARRMVADLSVFHGCNGPGGHVTLSLGQVSRIPGLGEPGEGLRREADIRMRQAKDLGGDRVVGPEGDALDEPRELFVTEPLEDSLGGGEILERGPH